MKKSVMQKWVKALRSGEYKQGQEELKNRDGAYCCLGVLCEISAVGRFNKKGIYRTANDSSGTELPFDVKNWAGMASSFGSIGNETDLASLNDGNSYIAGLDREPFTFEEIADIIELTYKEL